MKTSEYKHLTHGFPPFYDARSRILILGSFPSVKSREAAFFYGHPQNRFWTLIAALCGLPSPVTEEDKRRFLTVHHIAMYDTIEECDILGSKDSSITNVTPADLIPIFRTADIRAVFCNGATSWKLYEKYQREKTGFEAVKLPSTSPANAAWSLKKLEEAWAVVKEYL